MQWNSPSFENPYLYLPLLQNTSSLNLEAVETVTPLISVAVPHSFVTIWNQPPQNTMDANELNQRLFMLGKGFSALIVAGRQKVTSREKSSPTDLVTDMDQGIEMLFRIWIQTHYPHHKIVGEEGYKDTFCYNDITWFIDPIDGTRNFVEGNDNVTVHLGAIYCGKPYASYVGLPFYDRHYQLGDQIPQHHLPTRSESNLILGSEFLSSRTTEAKLFNQLVTQFNATSHRKMSIGLSIIDTWYGDVDLFYKPFLKPWDAIAPLLLLIADSKSKYHCLFYSNETKSLLNLFPLSPNLIDFWSNTCQSHCRVGHIILIHEQHLKKRDYITAAFDQMNLIEYL